jgi:hypothetical protein
MTTGIESWNVALMTIGPMYPFVGSETILAIIGVATWIAWHWLQARQEKAEIEQEVAEHTKPEAVIKAIDDQA